MDRPVQQRVARPHAAASRVRPGAVSKRSIPILLIAAGVMSIPAGLRAGDTPGSNTGYLWPEGTALERVTFSLTPLVDPGRMSNIFWSNQFDFTGGQTAYTGMQSNGGAPRQFLFSVWDAVESRPGSRGSNCEAFGGEGEGQHCTILHEWWEGQEFVFDVEHEGDRWFRATVTEVSSGVSFRIGSIRASSSRISGEGMSTWTEYFEWNDDSATCLNQPYSRVLVKWPRGDGGAVRARLDASKASDTCSHDSRIETLADGVLQTNAIGNSRRGNVTIAGGDCLDASGGADSGTEAITYACNRQDNQAWVYARDGSLQLRQGLCLDVANAARAAGSPVIVFECNGADNQRWTHAGGQLKGLGSGLCLTAHDGDPLTVEPCAEGTSQQWRLP